MRVALAIGLIGVWALALSDTALAQTATTVPAASTAAPAIQPVQPANPTAPVTAAPAASSVTASVLSADDVSLYRQAFAAARHGQSAKAKALADKASNNALAGYVEAAGILAGKSPSRDVLVKWLSQYRDLSVADRVYRLAVSRSTKKVRRGRKTITVAVVTNIPAPASVGRRTGGYEDAELPEPMPSSEVARALMPQILADIKAGNPDKALGRLDTLQEGATASSDDIAVLSHRCVLSRRRQGRGVAAIDRRSFLGFRAPAGLGRGLCRLSPGPLPGRRRSS
jgi:hypothetical protein